MTDHLLTIDRNAIKGMSSTRTDRIALSYGITNDVCFRAGEMLSEYVGTAKTYTDTAEGDRQLSKDVTSLLDHSTINACLALQPSRTQPRVGLVIDVITPDGQRLHRSIYAPSEDKEAAKIVSEYLAMGAPGLRADIRQSFTHQHHAFMKRQQGET